MPSFFTAIQFVFRLLTERFPRSVSRETHFHANGKKFAADVYRRRDRKHSRGVILAVHGMSVLGYRDPRMIILGHALSEAGHTVVVPLFEDIRGMQVHPGEVGDIAALIQQIAADRELCPDGRLALFAPSFSGTMAILAAARPGAAPLVNAVCAIGPYAEQESVLSFFFEGEDVDEYGKWVVFYNFGPYAYGRHEKLQDTIMTAIQDSGWRREEQELELPAKVAALPPKEREIFENVRTDRDYRMRLFHEKLLTNADCQDLAAKMGLTLENLRGLECPVVLVHGRHDDVISPDESRLIYQRLGQLGKKRALSITSLISHGDTGIGPSIVVEGWHLLRSFSYFFKHIR